MEERWNRLGHGDGQGYQQRKSQEFSHIPHSRWTLYMSADDGINGAELWKSDGTTSGTVMVKDINSGSGHGYPNQLTVVGNISKPPTHPTDRNCGRAMEPPLVMIKDINSGSSGSFPNHLAAFGNTLYFQAIEDTNGYELWKSDGTASGTVMVKDINSGSGFSSPTDFTAVGITLYFRADDGTHGQELWKSDGTASGTVMVKDIYSGIGTVSTSQPLVLSVSQRRTQRIRIVEERWNYLRYGDGQGYQQRK